MSLDTIDASYEVLVMTACTGLKKHSELLSVQRQDVQWARGGSGDEDGTVDGRGTGRERQKGTHTVHRREGELSKWKAEEG